jgi:hypothetical protein
MHHRDVKDQKTFFCFFSKTDFLKKQKLPRTRNVLRNENTAVTDSFSGGSFHAQDVLSGQVCGLSAEINRHQVLMFAANVSTYSFARMHNYDYSGFRTENQ